MIHRHDLTSTAPPRREPSPHADLAPEILDATARALLAPVWALGVRSSALRRPPEATPRERELLDFVGAHAQRIARVLAGVLDYVQVERAGLVLDARPARLEEICELAVEELRAAGADGRIVCEGVGDGGGEWDPGRLAQAISYLVELVAAGAAPGEPVFLRWRGDEEEVVVRVEAGRGRVPFRIDPEWGDAPTGDGGVRAFLARRIAAAHGGLLARFTADGATSLVLVLPRRAPEDPGDEDAPTTH